MGLRRLALSVLVAATLPGAPIGYVSEGTTLYTIDPLTANVLSSVPLSEIGVNALALSPQNVLYGVFFGLSIGTINPETGAVSILGTNDVSIEGITFDALGEFYALSIPQIHFASPITGIIGGVAGCANAGGPGIVADAPNAPWISSGNGLLLATLDSNGCGGGSTGSETGSGVVPVDLAAIHRADGLIFGIQRLSDGSVQLVNFDGTVFNGTPGINAVGPLPSFVNSLAVGEGDFTPEPASVWLLGLGIAGAILYRRYR